MQKWTSEQQELLELRSDGMPILDEVAVTADAGSGKTSVLVERVKRIISVAEKAKQLNSHRVLCVSFTEKSKLDLESRLYEFWSVDVFTIHGFCARLIQEYGVHLGFPVLQKVLDPFESKLLLKECFEKAYRRNPPKNIDHRASIFFDLCLKVSQSNRSEFQIIDQTEKNQEVELFVKNVLEDFKEKKKSKLYIDFQDMESMALELLMKKEVRSLVQNRYRHLFIDEFQDTNATQCEILSKVRSSKCSLFVVGDPKQSIYRFRGAQVEVFEKFCSQLKYKKELTNNFRSHPKVINQVNETIKVSFDSNHKMVAARSKNFYYETELEKYRAGKRVFRFDQEERGDAILPLLTELVSSGIDLKDIVLLYPQVKSNLKILKKLRNSGISLTISSSQSIQSEEPFKALCSLWIWFQEPWNKKHQITAALFFTDNVNEDRKKLLQNLKKVETIRDSVLKEVDISQTLLLFEKLRDVFSLQKFCGSFVAIFLKFLVEHKQKGNSSRTIARELDLAFEEENSALFQKMIMLPPPALSGTLRVLTVHASKGLEFPIVFLADLKNGKSKFGAIRSKKDDHKECFYLLSRDEDGDLEKETTEIAELIEEEKKQDLEESARLFYVAQTRAQEALFYLNQFKEDPKLSRENSWSVWTQKTLPSETELELKTTTKLSTRELTKNKTFSSLKLPNIQKSKARIGVTDYLKNTNISFVIGTEPQTLQTNESSKNYAEIGTQIHAFLEVCDWNSLKNYGLDQKLNLNRFFSWLKTEEADAIFGKSYRVFPEIALEWRESEEVLTGRLDRLIQISESEYWIIDFKTVFKKNSKTELIDKYRNQLELYKSAVKKLTNAPRIRLFIVDVLSSSGEVLLELE